MNPERPEAARWFYGADTANTRCAVLRNVSVGRASLLEMSRHTTFRFCLDPTDEQQHLLTRHAGATRFAFNQCLRIVKDALSARLTNPSVDVPWTGFDLINAFNSWKKTPDAGRFSWSASMICPASWQLDSRGARKFASRCSRKLQSIAVVPWWPGQILAKLDERAVGSDFPASRRRALADRRSDYATSRSRDAVPRSVLVTTIVRGL